MHAYYACPQNTFVGVTDMLFNPTSRGIRRPMTKNEMATNNKKRSGKLLRDYFSGMKISDFAPEPECRSDRSLMNARANKAKEKLALPKYDPAQYLGKKC